MSEPCKACGQLRPARMLTVSGLAREFGWDRKAVRAWLQRQAVPAVVTAPSKWYYDRKDIEKAIEATKARTPEALLKMTDRRRWPARRDERGSV